MKAEEKIVDFVCDTRFKDLPQSVLKTIKNQLLAVTGTTLAGATEDGCEQAVRFSRELGEAIAAVIQPVPGDKPTEAEMFSYCEKNLPRYKRPGQITFAEVPRSSTGKLENPKLRKAYAEGRLEGGLAS
jgi:acyl-CoA synthetase (AMP-forming)/AMP-acid ligase II